MMLIPELKVIQKFEWYMVERKIWKQLLSQVDKSCWTSVWNHTELEVTMLVWNRVCIQIQDYINE